jgi:hypothetical protein
VLLVALYIFTTLALYKLVIVGLTPEMIWLSEHVSPSDLQHDLLHPN